MILVFVVPPILSCRSSVGVGGVLAFAASLLCGDDCDFWGPDLLACCLLFPFDVLDTSNASGLDFNVASVFL